MLKNNVIHGVGQAIILDFVSGREILRLTRMESTGWTIAYEEQDVHGGDDLDIFENFEVNRTQNMSFQNNEFDMRMLEVATGKRPIKTLSAPIVELSEGAIIPASPGPYTATLKRAASTDDASVMVQYNDTREKFSPQPALVNGDLAEEPAVTTFILGTVVDVRITAVVGGIESIASSVATLTIVTVAGAGVDVQLPSSLLTLNAELAAWDVEIDGFNIYVDDGTNPEYKSNSALIDKGTLYSLMASPGDGAASPDTTPTQSGQYSVAAGVITFSDVDAGRGVLMDYTWTTSSTVYQAEVVDVVSKCLREYVKIVLRQSYKSKDNTVLGLQAVIHKAKYTGDFMIDSTRADASTHALDFKIFDPERADEKIVSFTKFNLGVSEPC